MVSRPPRNAAWFLAPNLLSPLAVTSVPHCTKRSTGPQISREPHVAQFWEDGSLHRFPFTVS